MIGLDIGNINWRRKQKTKNNSTFKTGNLSEQALSYSNP